MYNIKIYTYLQLCLKFNSQAKSFSQYSCKSLQGRDKILQLCVDAFAVVE